MKKEREKEMIGKKKHSLGMFWGMKFMFHCSLVLFLLGALATVSFYNTSYNAPVLVRLRSSGTTSKKNVPVFDGNPRKTTNVITLNASIGVFGHSRKAKNDVNVSKSVRVLDHSRRVKNVNKSMSIGMLDQPRIRAKVPALVDRCDLFSGRWVYDNSSRYPLYKELECPYMHGDLACQTWGRKDLKYQKWKWQPHGCDLPRFDGKAVLEKLRGKRVMFVGDSLNRNQWVSMVCMLQSSIPEGFKSVDLQLLNASMYTFKATEYNTSIDFYWAPLLIESNGDNPSNHHVFDRVIRSNSIEKHAQHWLNYDILVFNSYLWWRASKIKILHSGSFDGSDQVYEERDSWHSYEMVLEAWSKWLLTHIEPSKTKLFWMSMSATHMLGEEWGRQVGKNCYGETEPVTKDGFWESGSDPKMMRILESSLSKLKGKGLNVELMNITQLTQYRKDAHPSVYKRRWRPPTEEQQKNPSSYSDCSHWCLPGVPDVWNELLSAYFLR